MGDFMFFMITMGMIMRLVDNMSHQVATGTNIRRSVAVNPSFRF